MTLCPCGKELHYLSAEVREALEEAVAKHGGTVELRIGGELVAVPRHFAALHSPVSVDDVRRHGFVVR